MNSKKNVNPDFTYENGAKFTAHFGGWTKEGIIFRMQSQNEELAVRVSKQAVIDFVIWCNKKGIAPPVEKVKIVYEGKVSEEKRLGYKKANLIMLLVAEGYQIECGFMLTSRKVREVVRARQAAMVLIRWLTSLSSPEIGKLFRKHHATVLLACRSFNKGSSHFVGLSETVKQKVEEVTLCE